MTPIQEIALEILDWPGKRPIYTDDELRFLQSVSTSEAPLSEDDRGALELLTKRYDEATDELLTAMRASFFAGAVAEGRMDLAEDMAGMVLQPEPDGGAA